MFVSRIKCPSSCAVYFWQQHKLIYFVPVSLFPYGHISGHISVQMTETASYRSPLCQLFLFLPCCSHWLHQSLSPVYWWSYLMLSIFSRLHGHSAVVIEASEYCQCAIWMKESPIHTSRSRLVWLCFKDWLIPSGTTYFQALCQNWHAYYYTYYRKGAMREPADNGLYLVNEPMCEHNHWISWW